MAGPYITTARYDRPRGSNPLTEDRSNWVEIRGERRCPHMAELEAKIAAMPEVKPGPKPERKQPLCPDCGKPAFREGCRCTDCANARRREGFRRWRAAHPPRKTLIRRGRVLSESQKHEMALAMGGQQ